MTRWLPILSVLVAVGVLQGCGGGTDPDLEMRLARLQGDLESAQAESAEAQKTVEDLRGELRGLIEENRTLTDRLELLTLNAGDQRVAQLERELAAAQQDAARYRAGLEGAVDTLNQQAQKHQLDSYVSELEKQEARRDAQRAQRTRTPSSGGGECCVHVRSHYLSHVTSTVIVSGDIKNDRSDDISGDAVVDLFDGNERVDTQSVRMSIPSGLVDTYEVTFSGVKTNGSYRARVRWEDFAY